MSLMDSRWGPRQDLNARAWRRWSGIAQPADKSERGHYLDVPADGAPGGVTLHKSEMYPGQRDAAQLMIDTHPIAALVDLSAWVLRGGEVGKADSPLTFTFANTRSVADGYIDAFARHADQIKGIRIDRPRDMAAYDVDRLIKKYEESRRDGRRPPGDLLLQCSTPGRTGSGWLPPADIDALFSDEPQLAIDIVNLMLACKAAKAAQAQKPSLEGQLRGDAPAFALSGAYQGGGQW